MNVQRSRSRRSVLLRAGVLALVLATGACSGGSPDRKPAAADAPTTLASRPIRTGAVFFEDKFVDKSRKWPEVDDANVAYRLNTADAVKSYSLTLKKPNEEAVPHPPFSGIVRAQLADYAVEASLRSTAQLTVDDGFGVTCRDLSGSRYIFELRRATTPSVPLTWSILRDNGTPQRKTLATGTEKASGSTYTVQGACVGGKTGSPAYLQLSINGRQVGQATDAASPLTEGLAGVYLSNNGGHGTATASIDVLHFSARDASLG